ncbi:MAG: hypothetical protein KJ767_01735 [Nanoarchaeota archaeon]|nr:hypothetical protein [Nanoarchaeota archaeon]
MVEIGKEEKENLATVLNKAEERLLIEFEKLPEEEKFVMIEILQEDMKRVERYNTGKLAEVGKDEVNNYFNKVISLIEQYQG